MEKVHTTERLTHLRKLMQQHNLDVYSTLYRPELEVDSCSYLFSRALRRQPSI